MAGKRVSMRKVFEVLRLHHELGWGQRQIARGAQLSVSTVHEYLERFRAAGLTWPLPGGWGEAELTAALTPPARPHLSLRPQPDWARLHGEMQSHRHLTLQLLWEEYRTNEPGGYTYSRFCYLYRAWRRQGEVVLRQFHRPGERLFVDWAGPTVPIHDPVTGVVTQAAIFVATLGASYAQETIMCSPSLQPTA